VADEPQAAEWKPSFPLIRRIDEYWVKGERILCGAMFLLMSVLVFLGVVASVFANRREWLDPIILFGVVLLALRTRALKEGEKRWPMPIMLGVAAAGTAALSGLVVLYTNRYPGGITEVRPLALCMMLWVALLGASIATFDRSHLALEMGEKLWPAKIRHYVKALARGLAAACCLLLLDLSWIEVTQRHDFWASSTGGLRSDIVPGLTEWGVPAWLVLLVMPYTFAAMAIRMGAQAVTLATRRDKPLEDRLPS
jgi:TRAP-type C4-dicarboxylate transport system permease small subunit